MFNPLKKSDLHKTHDRVLLRRGYDVPAKTEEYIARPVYIVPPLYKKIRRRGKLRRVLVRRGYRVETVYKTRVIRRAYRVKAIYRWVPKPKAAEAGWRPVWEYQADLTREYELRNPDLIYRFNPSTDVIDEGTKFVWDKPLSRVPGGGYLFPSNVGGFRGIRAWFLVSYESEDRFEIWARTYKLPPLVREWSQVMEHLEALEKRFLAETEKGMYRMVDFLAFTVYVKIRGRGGLVTDRWSQKPGQAGWEKMPTRKTRKQKTRTGNREKGRTKRTWTRRRA